jgi:predicted DNA-binding transcriptional regulator AlpA
MEGFALLDAEDLRTAEQLLIKLREIASPPPPEYIKDGQELADLLGVSRCTSWKVAKDPTFPPAIRLGPKLRLRKRAEILAWMASRAEKQGTRSEGPGAKELDLRQLKPRGKRGTIGIDRHEQ